MKDLILYPTETVYGLGVNALDQESYQLLFDLKKRPKEKAVSWIVRNIEDIETYAHMDEKERKIADAFLPGPLSLVLPLKEEVIEKYGIAYNTIAFRVSPDPIAQKLISEYMEKHGAPLTCTSANISEHENMPTVAEILEQFGESAHKITKIIDDGPRKGTPSTVVSVVDGMVGIIREGAIPASDIYASVQ